MPILLHDRTWTWTWAWMWSWMWTWHFREDPGSSANDKKKTKKRRRSGGGSGGFEKRWKGSFQSVFITLLLVFGQVGLVDSDMRFQVDVDGSSRIENLNNPVNQGDFHHQQIQQQQQQQLQQQQQQQNQHDYPLELRFSNVKEAMNTAKEMEKNRQIPVAIAIARKVIAVEKGNIEAMIMLGNLLSQDPRGRKEAFDYLRKALEISSDPSIRLAMGNLLWAWGEIHLARDQFNFVVASNQSAPRLKQASHFALAKLYAYHSKTNNAASNEENLWNALRELKAAERLSSNTKDAELAFHEGLTLDRLGLVPQAVESYSKAIAIDPSMTFAHANKAVLLLRQGLNEDAFFAAATALNLEPMNGDLHNNLGVVFYKSGNREMAEKHWKEAIRLKSGCLQAHASLGNIYQDKSATTLAKKHWEIASTLALSSSKIGLSLALKIRSRLGLERVYESLNHVSNIRQRYENELQTLLEESVPTSTMAELSQIDGLSEMITDIGYYFVYLGYSNVVVREQQAKLFRKLVPELGIRGGKSMFLKQQDALSSTVVSSLSLNPSVSKKGSSSSSKTTVGSEENSQGTHEKEAEKQNKKKKHSKEENNPIDLDQESQEICFVKNQETSSSSLTCVCEVFTGNEISEKKEWKVDQSEMKKKLRIGFISEFFADHSVSKLVRNTIRLLSTQQKSEFEIIIFVIENAEQGSDSQSKLLADFVDTVVHVNANYETLLDNVFYTRKVVQKQKLDILVFPEIGMGHLTYFVAHGRIAPVQVAFWGHPVSSGLPDTVDYFISSHYFEGNWKPARDGRKYSEKLWLMEGLSTLFPRPPKPYYQNPQVARDELLGPGFADANVYLCPQTAYKFHPLMDRSLVEILLLDPKGILVVIESKRKEWIQIVRERILQQATARGVENANDRIVVVPPQPLEKFLSLVGQVADVVLDTFPFGGGVSHFEALSVAAPVVVFGHNIPWIPQYANGIYEYIFTALESKASPRLVVKSVKEYVNTAIQIAKNPSFREDIRNKIRQAVEVSGLFYDPDRQDNIAKLLSDWKNMFLCVAK